MQLYAEENDAWSDMDCLQLKQFYNATASNQSINQSTIYTVKFM